MAIQETVNSSTIHSPLPRGYKRTAVGVIPKEWRLVRLSDVVNIIGGGTPSTQVAEYWNGTIPWVSAGDISRSAGRYISNTEKSISEIGLASCSARVLPKGTVVIIARGATVGRMAQLGTDMTFNQTCYGLMPTEGLDQDYLYYAMRKTISSMAALTYGTVFGTITTQSFHNWHISLPPLPEQRAIAGVLSDVDALLAALDRLLAKKRAIKQGAMQALLSGRVRLPGFAVKAGYKRTAVGVIPEDWEVKTLSEIGAYSKGRGIKRDDISDNGIPCIRYGEIYTTYDNYVSRLVSKISAEIAAQSQEIKKGDLLFTGSGETADEIGKCVAYIGDDVAYAGGDIIILSPYRDDTLFLGFLTNFATTVEQKSKLGQGDAVAHISTANLGTVKIPLPPLPEQRAIAGVLSDVDAEVAALERRRAKLRALKQGMMEELLTGRIRLVAPQNNQ